MEFEKYLKSQEFGVIQYKGVDNLIEILNLDRGISASYCREFKEIILHVMHSGTPYRVRAGEYLIFEGLHGIRSLNKTALDKEFFRKN